MFHVVIENVIRMDFGLIRLVHGRAGHHDDEVVGLGGLLNNLVDAHAHFFVSLDVTPFYLVH